MRLDNLLSAAAARLSRLVVVCFVVAAASSVSFAQTQAGDERAAAPARSTADEEFDLNIERRRISEKDFHAETAVETDGARGLRLGVGVALRASNIEVLLLGVRGHVRFRGSLAPVLRLLEARRPAPTQTPPP
ncbi:MAG TPA: hypothetical protein VF591_09700 [Pyrinomonadaceae bacterium]